MENFGMEGKPDSNDQSEAGRRFLRNVVRNNTVMVKSGTDGRIVCPQQH